MIGTNNTGHQGRNMYVSPPEKTAEVVTAIVHTLKTRLPETKILLLGVFPRGATADDPLLLRAGGRLDHVEVAFETYGELNPTRDNVVFVCHALTGDSHVAGAAGPGVGSVRCETSLAPSTSTTPSPGRRSPCSTRASGCQCGCGSSANAT